MAPFDSSNIPFSLDMREIKKILAEIFTLFKNILMVLLVFFLKIDII